ncbi:MAG: hypothetical protein A2Y24_06385 [Clostridiales bacterium GWE2_32_10]|nr:MAG: hypothetical protein A2Y24_06385 [Clostridiales bacterium GWE2_32_10]HBY20318.1 hypothetical protein [Clostridiales bacterium]
MNRKLLLLGVFACLVFLAVGCTKEQQNAGGTTGETTQVIYEKLETVPSELKTAVVDIEKMKGFSVIESNDNEKYIFIGLGEKPTDGYDVDVKSVKEANDKVTIEIDEIKPAADAKVTTAKTYPYVIVKVNTALDAFEVITTSGEQFKDVADETSETTDNNTTGNTTNTTTEDTTE